jgi:SAM-dependent methyltransferase
MAEAIPAPTLSGARWRRMVHETWSDAARAWEHWEAFNLHFLSAVDPVLLRALELKPGQRVLDFGSGTGEPALQIARWIGPGGTVQGLDIAGPMLEVARRRARLLGLRNARFRRGDISKLPARATYDRVCARFGLMFAEDVAQALGRVRAALKPGGRAAFAVWGPLALNPAVGLAAEAIRPFAPSPPPDPERAPHPMRLGRPGLLPRLMRGAGFRDVRAQRAPCYASYPDPDLYVTVILESSSVVRMVYASLGAADRRRVRERLRRGALRYRSGHAVRIPGLAWVVSGRR